MDLGSETDFTEFPAPVRVDGRLHFVVQGKKGYLLLSALCPHQGFHVKVEDDSFFCPNHGWRFELTEGVCINGPRAKMTSYPVTVEDGRLTVDL